MVMLKMERVARKLISPALVGVIVLLLASSCGDGGIGNFFAGGGISGTGRFSGTISGFGSVFVNGVEIETTGAQISIDDISSFESDLKVGMKVQIETIDNVADSIVYKSEIKGLVSSKNTVTNSFTVLGQTVFVDSTTVYEGLSGFAGLQVGDGVEVSGFADADDNMLATFIEFKNSLSEFKVTGTISNHDETGQTFTINDLIINYSGIQPLPDISNNTRVEVAGTMPGSILIATEIETEDISFSSGDEVEFEGVITFLTSPSDFVVNSQRVQTTSQTTYEHGTESSIAKNVRVEIEGTVNSSSILIAEKVEFRFVESKSIEIKGAVQSIDTENSTVTVFGITIHIDKNTGFKDEVQELRLFSLVNIQLDNFLEIGGFVDNYGNVIAARLERKESPDSNEFELRGPVDSETSNSLEILGVPVDVSNSDFEDLNDESISSLGAFFDLIDTGDVVEAKGSFSGGIFIATEVEIELIN